MGIVNTTPDSFSDGGHYLEPGAAVDHALRLVAEGADLLDVGGESTRPGSTPIDEVTELKRVLPVIKALAQQSDIPISIDTSKAEVARQSICAGAVIINDITALRGDPAMIDVATSTDTGVIIMHMLGTPRMMQQCPAYEDVVANVMTFLTERLTWLEHCGIDRNRIVIDPGIGFGKTTQHNLLLLQHLNVLSKLKRPICLGASRKRFIGELLDRSVEQRLTGTVAVNLIGYLRGANVLRVHDVAAIHDAIVIARAIERSELPL